MLTNVTCPACQHKYWIQEGEMGSRQICPNCQSPFFAGASVAEARPATSPAVTAASPASAVFQGGYAKTLIGETAAPVKYNCPRCKAALEAAASEAGTKKNCPHCTQRLQVPAAPKPEPMAASANLNKTMLAGDDSAAPPRPPIKYNCPNCKKPLEAPAEQGGIKTNCPACQQRLQIPAAIPIPSNRNRTMLASDESAAAANVSPGAYSADGLRGSMPAAAGPPPAAGPWAQALTPKNVAFGILVLLLLMLVVPAIIRGGNRTDNEALAKTQLELEKLKQEIELKKLEMDRQAKAETEARRQLDEMMRNSRAAEEKLREEERRRLRDIDDENKRVEFKRRLVDEQRRREEERAALEKKQQQLLEDAQRKLDETKRTLEASQQKQQTIIHQPAPVVYYPPYHPRYYGWWW
jgi:DNA-directed RNA polymerase subunit RPC12/RpoP